MDAVRVRVWIWVRDRVRTWVRDGVMNWVKVWIQVWWGMGVLGAQRETPESIPRALHSIVL